MRFRLRATVDLYHVHEVNGESVSTDSRRKTFPWVKVDTDQWEHGFHDTSVMITVTDVIMDAEEWVDFQFVVSSGFELPLVGMDHWHRAGTGNVHFYTDGAIESFNRPVVNVKGIGTLRNAVRCARVGIEIDADDETMPFVVDAVRGMESRT